MYHFYPATPVKSAHINPSINIQKKTRTTQYGLLQQE